MGAALAMLPGARLLDCRRDPLENCLSCYRQLFVEGHQYSYDLDELSSFWRDCDGLGRHWQQLYPGRVWAHSHDALLADPSRQLREITKFLQLDDEPAGVGTSGHVARLREPLRPPAPRAPRYASELDRLRILLGLA